MDTAHIRKRFVFISMQEVPPALEIPLHCMQVCNCLVASPLSNLDWYSLHFNLLTINAKMLDHSAMKWFEFSVQFDSFVFHNHFQNI